jgi:nitroreductase
MSGLTFHRSENYKEVVSYYRDKIKMSVWLEQGGCTILQKGNFLLGFCDRDEADTDGMITFFFDDPKEVDYYYSIFKDSATEPPKENPRFRIYHFFTKDPEGRNVEFQTFLHNVKPHHEGREMLQNRRSIRQFKNDPVGEEILLSIFEQCRYVPTSCNTQAYKYLLIRDTEKIEKLSTVRKGSSAPIGRSPLSVVVYVDTGETKRPEQDGAIASTYFLLSAAQHGVGTCWIGGMDTDEVKEILDLEKDKHISMISPVGWPGELKQLPERRTISEMVEGLK